MKPIYRSTWVVKERKERDCIKKYMENMWKSVVSILIHSIYERSHAGKFGDSLVLFIESLPFCT